MKHAIKILDSAAPCDIPRFGDAVRDGTENAVIDADALLREKQKRQ